MMLTTMHIDVPRPSEGSHAQPFLPPVHKLPSTNMPRSGERRARASNEASLALPSASSGVGSKQANERRRRASDEHSSVRSASPARKPALIDEKHRRVFGETSSTQRSVNLKFQHEQGVNARSAVPYYKQGDDAFETEEAKLKRAAIKVEGAEMFRAIVRCFWASANLTEDEQMRQSRYLEIHRLMCQAIAPRMPAKEAKKAGLLDWAHDAHGHDSISFDGYCDALFDLADQWTDSTEIEDYLQFVEMLYIRITKRIAPHDGPLPLNAYRRAFCRLPEVKALTRSLLSRGSADAARLRREELPPPPKLPKLRDAAPIEPVAPLETLNMRFESSALVVQWYSQLQRRRAAGVEERPSSLLLQHGTDLVVPTRWAATRTIMRAASRLAPIAPSSLGAAVGSLLDAGRLVEEEAEEAEELLPTRPSVQPLPPAALRNVRKKLEAATYGQPWSSLFSKVDKNRDGRLNVDELVGLVRKVLRIPPAVLPPVDLFDLHAFLDLDADGYISVGELHAFMVALEDDRQPKGPTDATLSDIASAQGAAGARRSPATPTAPACAVDAPQRLPQLAPAASPNGARRYVETQQYASSLRTGFGGGGMLLAAPSAVQHGGAPSYHVRPFSELR